MPRSDERPTPDELAEAIARMEAWARYEKDTSIEPSDVLAVCDAALDPESAHWTKGRGSNARTRQR